MTELNDARVEAGEIAGSIVDWYPNGAFTYDTYIKLKRDIADAIVKDRAKLAAAPLTSCRKKSKAGSRLRRSPLRRIKKLTAYATQSAARLSGLDAPRLTAQWFTPQPI